MVNRRQYYRHHLLPDLRLPTEIAWSGRTKPLAAVARDLSVEGVAIELDDCSVTLRKGEHCTATLTIPGEPASLTIPCTVVYANQNTGKPVFGLTFLSVADREAAEGRETIIWRFLLAEQRRQRRRQREQSF